MATGISPERAKQIIRNILSWREKTSYAGTRHEKLGVVVCEQGNDESIGEENSWKEIVEGKLKLEYELGKPEKTFNELTGYLKEGLAKYLEYLGTSAEKLQDFKKRTKISKSSLAQFLQDWQDVPPKKHSLRGELLKRKDIQTIFQDISCILQTNAPPDEKLQLLELRLHELELSIFLGPTPPSSS